jgi:tripartite-type tricarboxylate transporter receptor subunit TctC
MSTLFRIEGRVLASVALALACTLSSPVRGAEPAWKPQKNVELVIGAQPGGANDRMGRILQKILSDTGSQR